MERPSQRSAFPQIRVRRTVFTPFHRQIPEEAEAKQQINEAPLFAFLKFFAYLALCFAVSLFAAFIAFILRRRGLLIMADDDVALLATGVFAGVVCCLIYFETKRRKGQKRPRTCPVKRP